MKKVVILILTVLTALSISACGKDTGKKPSTGSDLSWKQIEKLADEKLEADAKTAEQAKTPEA